MTSKIKIMTKVAFFTILLIIVLPKIALAASCTSGGAYDCLSQSGPILQVLEIGLNFMAAAVGLIATIMLIIAGIQYSERWWQCPSYSEG